MAIASAMAKTGAMLLSAPAIFGPIKRLDSKCSSATVPEKNSPTHANSATAFRLPLLGSTKNGARHQNSSVDVGMLIATPPRTSRTTNAIIKDEEEHLRDPCLDAVFGGKSMSEPDHNARHRFITDPYGAGHYEKLGRFVFQYARAEAYFHLAFRFYSKMPIGEARILFGGPSRISDVID